MQTYFLIALGGALGSVLRFFLGGVIASRFGDAFPWGTLTINVTGSFLIGLFFATLTAANGRWLRRVPTISAYPDDGGNLRRLHHTFSAFSLQTLVLAREGDWRRAGGYIVSSVALCLAGVWLGHVLASRLNSRRLNELVRPGRCSRPCFAGITARSWPRPGTSLRGSNSHLARRPCAPSSSSPSPGRSRWPSSPPVQSAPSRGGAGVSSLSPASPPDSPGSVTFGRCNWARLRRWLRWTS